MADRSGYIGRAPGDSAVIIARQIYAPTGIQTDFTFDATYTPGYMDVYLNGVRLVYPTDYSASDGSTVGLTTNAISGDTLELVAYKAFNVGDVTEAKNNFTVGDKLTVSGVTTATSAYYTGSVTASSFSGDGSALTGMASTDNIITGTAVTISGISTGDYFIVNDSNVGSASTSIRALAADGATIGIGTDFVNNVYEVNTFDIVQSPT